MKRKDWIVAVMAVAVVCVVCAPFCITMYQTAMTPDDSATAPGSEATDDGAGFYFDLVTGEVVWLTGSDGTEGYVFLDAYHDPYHSEPYPVGSDEWWANQYPTEADIDSAQTE